MSQKLKFAVKLAKNVGKLLMQKIDKAVIKKYKKDGRDVIMDVDLKTEKIILKAIKKAYPSHKFCGEEYFEKYKRNEYVWFVDSLDGTKYYQAGIKLFSISVSLWQGRRPILGVVFLPASNDLYWAEAGSGSYHNKKRIKVSKRKNIKESIICLDEGHFNNLKPEIQKPMFKKLKDIFNNFYRVRMFGWGSASLCFLADGYFDAYFDLSGKVKIYDVAAGIIIAREAGAKITSVSGDFCDQNIGGVVVTNGKIHNKLLNLLNK